MFHVEHFCIVALNCLHYCAQLCKQAIALLRTIMQIGNKMLNNIKT